MNSNFTESPPCEATRQTEPQAKTLPLTQTLWGSAPNPALAVRQPGWVENTQPTPAAKSVGHYVGIKGSLRRVLTRSVLACGCAPLAASAPALDPASAQHAHSNPTIRRSAARGCESASLMTSDPPTSTTSRWARVTAV